MRSLRLENMERELHFTRTYGPDDQGQYLRLPFEVPPDTDRVEVEYAYERFVTEDLPDGRRRREAAIVDLGLYDETGRLRGWSGSERASVAISASSATPGYAAGPVHAGRWGVSLGLYKIHGTVEVRITIRLPEKLEILLAGDLHVHTVNSDGVLRTSEMVELCRREGLDFVALTDHNSTRQNDEIGREDGITLIPGMEYTNYRGHANFLFPAWNGQPPLDPLSNSFEQMRDTLAAAREAGATISLNHPNTAGCPWTFGFEGFAWDMVEVWNGTGDPGDARTIAWWHDRLCRGARAPAVGGSDFHRHELLRHVGAPATFVLAASRSAADIVAALRAGKSFIAFSRKGPLLDLRVGGKGFGESVTVDGPAEGTAVVRAAKAGDRVRLLDGRTNIVEWTIPYDGEHATRFAASPGAVFYRLEVRRTLVPGVELLVALSNPVFIEPARAPAR
jgi:hypothetical protein